MAMLDTATTGIFSATYTLMLSDEELPWRQSHSLMLTLMGSVAAAANILGDYNHDGVVDAADYTVWRDTYGQSVTETAAPMATATA